MDIVYLVFYSYVKTAPALVRIVWAPGKRHPKILADLQECNVEPTSYQRCLNRYLKCFFVHTSILLDSQINVLEVSNVYLSLIGTCMQYIAFPVCVWHTNANGCFNSFPVCFVCVTFSCSCCYVVCDFVPVIISVSGGELGSAFVFVSSLVPSMRALPGLIVMAMAGIEAKFNGSVLCHLATSSMQCHAFLSQNVPDWNRFVCV